MTNEHTKFALMCMFPVCGVPFLLGGKWLGKLALSSIKQLLHPLFWIAYITKVTEEKYTDEEYART